MVRDNVNAVPTFTEACRRGLPTYRAIASEVALVLSGWSPGCDGQRPNPAWVPQAAAADNGGAAAGAGDALSGLHRFACYVGASIHKSRADHVTSVRDGSVQLTSDCAVAASPTLPLTVRAPDTLLGVSQTLMDFRRWLVDYFLEPPLPEARNFDPRLLLQAFMLKFQRSDDVGQSRLVPACNVPCHTANLDEVQSALDDLVGRLPCDTVNIGLCSDGQLAKLYVQIISRAPDKYRAVFPVCAMMHLLWAMCGLTIKRFKDGILSAVVTRAGLTPAELEDFNNAEPSKNRTWMPVLLVACVGALSASIDIWREESATARIREHQYEPASDQNRDTFWKWVHALRQTGPHGLELSMFLSDYAGSVLMGFLDKKCGVHPLRHALMFCINQMFCTSNNFNLAPLVRHFVLVLS